MFCNILSLNMRGMGRVPPSLKMVALEWLAPLLCVDGDDSLDSLMSISPLTMDNTNVNKCCDLRILQFYEYVLRLDRKHTEMKKRREYWRFIAKIMDRLFFLLFSFVLFLVYVILLFQAYNVQE